jgi:hypothetical protein
VLCWPPCMSRLPRWPCICVIDPLRGPDVDDLNLTVTVKKLSNYNPTLYVLVTRVKKFGEMDNINQAIKYYQDTLELYPVGDTRHTSHSFQF